MSKIAVIVGSTREGRQTLKQAKWVMNTLSGRQGVEAQLLDLADYDLPFFAEPVSPRYNPNRVVEGDVKRWLDDLGAADGYIFVTPEYNHSIPAVLKNSFDFLDSQLIHKPAAIVSHGTVGGARAAMHLKEILSEGKAVPIPEFVAFHGVSEGVDEEGNLSEAIKANPYGPEHALDSLIDSLVWYTDALKTAREA